MALQGKGAVAIWNGIANDADAEFIEWHVREHIPERVGIPGFVSGRRYSAVDGQPAYFNYYEVESPDVLRSAAYLARLNDPSPWTQKVVAQFTDVSRTLCRVAASSGMGIGVFAEVLRFPVVADVDAAEAFVSGLVGDAAICAAHLFLRDEGPPQVTSETRLRRTPDVTWAGILIAEAVTEPAAAAVRAGMLSDTALRKAGLGLPAGRGLYRLDYMIRHEDVVARPPRNTQKEIQA
ncbi:MAG: hypothetical protein KF887_00980 [Paracoccaceae bacterium]|nr:MAG: hypothetical protein KF887_00980 [Paracoccaceae bacterium]